MNERTTLTVGSLFAGIGGFDLGLERAGMRSVWQCEIDPYAQRVLAKHWPDVLRVPDIRDVGAGTVPYVDVICGGFPCQDLSYAGAGAGLDGARSGLWSEYARVVGEIRPRYVVVENVSALLARGLGTVLGDLAALGYDAEYDCIPASAVGAPHRRDRIWLVAYPNSSGCEGQSTAELGGQHETVGRDQLSRRDGPPRKVADAQGARLEGTGLLGRSSVDGRAVGDASSVGWDATSDPRPAGHQGRQSARPARGSGGDRGGQTRWAPEPDVARVAHGVPDQVDRIRALGNALVPQIAEWIGRRILEYEGARDAA